MLCSVSGHSFDFQHDTLLRAAFASMDFATIFLIVNVRLPELSLDFFVTSDGGWIFSVVFFSERCGPRI